MSQYQNTVIYKIVCNDLNIIDMYVGSTTNFTMRKNRHKRSCYDESNAYAYNYKVYKMIRDNGGWDNWTMLEIEKYPCDDKNEARLRERHWYEQLNSTLNTARPIINAEDTKEYIKQYNITNNEELRQKKREYNELNKETILEYKRKYYQENKEKWTTEERKEKHKKWEQSNKEANNERKKEWRTKNTVHCDCGGHYIPDRKKEHLATTKHKDFINK